MRDQIIGVEPCVEEHQAAPGTFAGGKRCQFLERVRRAAHAARRGAAQRETLDTGGKSDRELLRDHPAKTNANDPTALPAQVLNERCRIRGIVGDGIGLGRKRRPPDAARVVRNDVKVRGEGLDERLGACERFPGPDKEQQALARARPLIVEVNSVDRDSRRWFAPF